MVAPVYMFTLAAQHAHWASVRQAVITGNIANANTSGYTAVEVAPFAQALADAQRSAMARTQTGHLGIGGTAGASAGADWEVTETGAPVALDMELMKADQTNRAFALDTAILGAFHRMLMASVRSGI